MSLKAERERRRRKKKEEIAQTGFWPDLCNRIDEGKLIPIISNAVNNDLIFDMDGDGVLGMSADDEEDDTDNKATDLTIEEQLSRAYAYWSDFPLPESHRLARVALFNSVIHPTDRLAAKQEYLSWLKGELLFQAEDDPNIDALIIEELQDQLDRPLSQIASHLGYPKPVAGQRNPLDLLAKLKLPIYITTSYFDFLEQALLANRVTPRTQICFWNGKPQSYLDQHHETDHHPHPSSENPIVYHLFGHETYPGSLVLTEDDFLDFLVKLAADIGQQEPILPHYLRERLTLSSLVLLGYRPGDWDFRVLFRGLITAASNIEMLNLAIQFDPEQRPGILSTGEIKTYLEGYFNPLFDVEWDSAPGFVSRLYDAWDRHRR